jgi:hypothetical protein
VIELVKFLVAILAATGLLSVANILLIKLLPSASFIYLLVFLTNSITIVLITQFINNKNDSLDHLESTLDSRMISEKSISIFIRILLYTLPIAALMGLYLVSVMDNKLTLGIEDANSWVSFILGIAAFVMSLITLWQSEGTYTKIFDALEDLKKNTDHIKTHTDVTQLLKDKNFIDDMVPQNAQSPSLGFQSSEDKTDEQEVLSIKELMNSSQIFK